MSELIQNKKSKGIVAFIFFLSLALSSVFAVFLVVEDYDNTEILIYILGFTFGFSISFLIDIYIISLMISKKEKTEMSFNTSKIIVSISLLPLVLIFIFRYLFPFAELADFYALIGIIWYFILILRGIIQVYSIKIFNALVVCFNIIIVKLIIIFTFTGLIL